MSSRAKRGGGCERRTVSADNSWISGFVSLPARRLKNGNPHLDDARRSHSNPQVPNPHGAYPGSSVLLTLKRKEFRSRQGCLRRSQHHCPRRRRMRRPNGLFVLTSGRSGGTYLDHINNRLPLAVELSDLLVRYLQQNCDGIIVPGILCMH